MLILLLGSGVTYWNMQKPALPGDAPAQYAEKQYQSSGYSTRKKTLPQLKSISLNEADSARLETLPGIGKVLSARIVKYRKIKGGFASLEELKKVYGLSAETYEQILPYLTLGAAPEKPARKLPVPIEINTADTAAWASLPGIGKVLSARIVKYRDAKGGFKALEEVAKVYGLSPETFAEIAPYLSLAQVPEKPANTNAAPEATTSNARVANPEYAPKKVFEGTADLNTADSALLVQIPGFGAKIAPRVMKYRQILGFYADADLVKQVYGLSEENYQRARPFLTATPPASHTYLNLNGTTARQLDIMAIISKEEATRLLAARMEQGRFTTWDEVKQANLSPQSLFRLQAYFRL